MARRPARSAPRRTVAATLEKLRRDLDACSSKVEALENEAQAHFKRMAVMQAEINHLLAMMLRRIR